MLLEEGVLDVLLERIRTHLRVNEHPVPPNLSALVEAQMCEDMPKGVCTGDPDNSEVEMSRISTAQIRDYTRLIFERRRMGEKFFVSQEEAERRAKICTGCPENVRGICTTCNGLKQYAARFLVGRKTSLDHRIGVCAKCGCMLAAKVPVAFPALDRTEPHDYPAN